MSVSKQFKAQTGAYKVRVKQGRWQGYDTARLEISVGQPYHEGEKFRAAVAWARERFPNVVLLVNDTLQRFNMMFETRLPEAEAERITGRLGDEWMERNSDATAGCLIVRWNDWKSKPDYPQTHRKTLRLFNTNRRFRAAITNAIAEVWDRRCEEGTPYAPERKDEFFRNSRDYLLEETTILAMAYRTFPGVSVYPGSFLEMWSMFVDVDIAGAPEGLRNAHCVRIDFSKNKKPQAPPPAAKFG